MIAGLRHQAREAALQALYFCEVGRTDPAVALEAVFRDHRPDAGDDVRAFAAELVQGVTSDTASLDAQIARHSTHWRIERLAVVDRLILRLGAWELGHALGTPPAVVLNEAVELARTFSGEEAVAFVNGVLDAIRLASGRSSDA